MSLRDQAERDLAVTLEGADWGRPIQVTDPAGTTAELFGSTGDIAAEIDPDTGALVIGATIPITLRKSSLTAAGLGVPIAVPEKTSKPWLIQFDDLEGVTGDWHVIESIPDKTLGRVTCLLARWVP